MGAAVETLVGRMQPFEVILELARREIELADQRVEVDAGWVPTASRIAARVPVMDAPGSASPRSERTDRPSERVDRGEGQPDDDRVQEVFDDVMAVQGQVASGGGNPEGAPERERPDRQRDERIRDRPSPNERGGADRHEEGRPDTGDDEARVQRDLIGHG